MNEPVASSGGVANYGPKKKTPTPRARASPKSTAASRAAAKNRTVVQFPSEDDSQPQQPVNDPSRYAMVNQAQQQQQLNKVTFNKFQTLIHHKIYIVQLDINLLGTN